MKIHPELNQVAQIIPMGAGGAANEGINISLKNVHKAMVVCMIEQGADATQTTFSLRQSTGNAGNAAGTGEKVFAKNVRIWANQNCATNNVLTRQSDGVNFETDNQQSRTKMVVFEVIPGLSMDIANGFDCLTVDSTDPGADNVAHVYAVLEPARYAPLATVYAD